MGYQKIIKGGALALGLLSISGSGALAAGVSFLGEPCPSASSCTLSITDGGPGATLTVARVDGQDIDTTDGAFGLGIGYLQDNSGGSFFPEALTFRFNRDVTWNGGGFSSVYSGPDAALTPAVSITVGGDPQATFFGGEANFNRVGTGLVASSTSGLTPQPYTTGFDFLAGVIYTLTSDSFGAASAGAGGDPDSEAYVQLVSMDLTVTSVPLPATAWMLLGAVGLLGWRKYRTA